MANKDIAGSYHMLICLIEIWHPKEGQKPADMISPTTPPDVMLTEVGNIEIRESYENIIGNAALSFPKGTVIRKTIEPESHEAESDFRIEVGKDSDGTIIERRSHTEVATTDHFKIKSRIRISLGYTDDPDVYALRKPTRNRPSIYTSEAYLSVYRGHLNYVFNGYIRDCSADFPVTINCDDFGYLLKQTVCEKYSTNDKSTVKQILYREEKDKNGNATYKGLLSKSGLHLHPDTEDIVVGKCTIVSDYTIFDVLDEWQKWKIFAFIDNDNEGRPCLSVRSSFYSGSANSLVDPKRLDVSAPIDFLYNVASNNLTIKNIRTDQLAVKATSKNNAKNDKAETTTLTIYANPEWKEGDKESDKWMVVNETKVSKKAKKKHHIKTVSEGTHKVDLSNFHVVEYHSRKIGLTHDQLLDEAIDFFERYNKNGIEGNLVLFGDLGIRTTDIVELVDPRSPQKNGKYLVSEVLTNFGTNGYRQTIKLPYCLERKGQTR